MALAGKELGKDVGQWFGPSTAAGAIKCVNDDTLIISSYINLYSEPSFITSQKHRSVSPLPSTARSSRATYIQPRSHQRVHLGTASFQDGANAQSLSLLVFGLVLTVSTPSIMTRLRCVACIAFHMLSADTFLGALHVPTVDRHSWRPAIVFVLLCWLASRQPILP